MAKQTYEVRGLKFLVRSSGLVLNHVCTFSISLRIPSRKYWVAFYKWQEGADPYNDPHVYENVTTVASGAGVLPSILQLDDVSFPKDVLDFNSRGTVEYVQKKNTKFVQLKIDSVGDSGSQTLRFNLAQSSTPTRNVRDVFSGVISLWVTSKREQTLQDYPNSAPPHAIFSPYQ